MPTQSLIRTLTLLLGALTTTSAFAIDLDRVEVRSFIDKMVTEHQFERAQVEATLRAADTKPAILDAISKPAEKTIPWFEYRARFMDDKRINKGGQFYKEHRNLLDMLASQGAPTSVILGILGVETQYGGITGRYRVLDALSTLGFDYPPRKDFFLYELEQYLLMCREQKLDAKTLLGSYAGAMGSPQFMPHSVRLFAVDYNADGKVDLWNNWDDVLASVASYLQQHGWRAGEPIVADATLSSSDTSEFSIGDVVLNETVGSLKQKGVQFSTTLPSDAPAVLIALRGQDGPIYRVGFNNFYVITRYNRSPLYANAVYDLGQVILANAKP